MNYIIWIAAVLLGVGLLICLYWGACLWLDGYRYKRAINRRVREIDAEMRKRGGMV